jgi:hypothetical protein
MKKINCFILYATLVFLPQIARAQLVPCGKQGDPCELCDIFTLFDNILDFIFLKFVPPIAVLAIIIGGVYFFMAGGDPAKLGKAEGILTAVVIGLLIVYGSWLLINEFFVMIGVGEWTGLQNWFEYPCH